MASRFGAIEGRRAIIDRRILSERIATAGRDEAAAILKQALADGRAEIARRLEEHPRSGSETASSYAFLTDQILRLAYDYVVERLHPLANPTTAERLLLMAVGGYGRGEMALHSDVDIGFITPWKPTGWTEQAVEAILYLLWDLGLKVGQSVRSADEVVSAARGDHTIRTALLESRYVWGDEALFDEVQAKLDGATADVSGFVTEKLNERSARHKRMGDSRYLVEPNVKEGKGGLRDLHTLFWIGKYA